MTSSATAGGSAGGTAGGAAGGDERASVVAAARRLVIKVGSSLVTNDGHFNAVTGLTTADWFRSAPP